MGISKLIPSVEGLFPGIKVDASTAATIPARTTHLYIDGNFLLHTASGSRGGAKKKASEKRRSQAVSSSTGPDGVSNKDHEENKLDVEKISFVWHDARFDDPVAKDAEIEVFLRKVISALNDAVAPYLDVDHQRTSSTSSALRIFLFFDGPGSRAKLLVSRDRRRKDESSFWRQALTPGTEVMQTLLKNRVEAHFCQKFVRKRGEVITKIVFSDADVPGEGEHKIIEAINEEEYYEAARAREEQKGSSSWCSSRPTFCHVILGGDSDLLLCGLNAAERLNQSQLYFNFAEGGKLKNKPSSGAHFIDVRKLQAALLSTTTARPQPPSGFFAKPSDHELTLRRDFTFLSMLQGNDYVPGVSLNGAWNVNARWRKYTEITARKNFQAHEPDKWGIVKVVRVSQSGGDQYRFSPLEEVESGKVYQKWYYCYHRFCTGTASTSTLEEILLGDENGVDGGSSDVKARNSKGMLKKGASSGKKGAAGKGKNCPSSQSEAAAPLGLDRRSRDYFRAMLWTLDCYSHGYPYTFDFGFSAFDVASDEDVVANSSGQEAPAVKHPQPDSSRSMLTGEQLVGYMRRNQAEFTSLLGPGVKEQIWIGQNRNEESKGEGDADYYVAEDHNDIEGSLQATKPLLPLTRCLSVVPVHRLSSVLELSQWKAVMTLFQKPAGFLSSFREKERQLLAFMAETKRFSALETAAHEALSEYVRKSESLANAGIEKVQDLRRNFGRGGAGAINKNKGTTVKDASTTTCPIEISAELERLLKEYETRLADKEKHIAKVARWRRTEFTDIDKIDLYVLDSYVRKLLGPKAVAKQRRYYATTYRS
ncbi:unnamed protein product [Amoebophrya sp. A120]|nr:unnamed protein product [Amoebophrya sp. A120]|eukprot:GSA120T00001053001.1